LRHLDRDCFVAPLLAMTILFSSLRAKRSNLDPPSLDIGEIRSSRLSDSPAGVNMAESRDDDLRSV
jgi:alkylhydroperoxidase family enzyme